MSSIEHHIRQLAPDGLRIHIWARKGGGYQVNVSEAGSGSWAVGHGDDPIFALANTLRQRATGAPGRVVNASDGYVDAPKVEPEPVAAQVDLEEAIAAVDAAPVADDFGDLLG